MVAELKLEPDGETSTVMWNPLHFAVYYGHLPVLEYFIDELRITCPFLCLSKPPADNEEDIKNSLKYIEDKMYSLMIAYERNHMDVFKYLVNRFSKEWPQKTIKNFLEERWTDGYPQWIEAVTILMSSSVGHAYYQQLDYAGKNSMVFGMMRDICADEKFS